ncbi:hypothetical protein [Cryobacterium sp. AP23]
MNRYGSWLTIAAALTLLVSGCGAGGVGSAATPSPSAAEEVPEPVAPLDLPIDESWGELPKSPLSARRSSVGAWVEGRFLVVGGWSDPPCPPTADCAYTEPAQRDGASFNPYSGVWARIASAPVPVSEYSSAVLNGDLFLFAYDVANGGLEVDGDGQMLVSFLRYNSEADAWTALPSPPSGGHLVAAGERVLSISGSDENIVGVDAVFDPERSTWTALPDDPLGPSYDREAVWLGESLLLSAKPLKSVGEDGPSLVRLATLDGTFTSWSALPDSAITGIGAIAVAGLAVFPFYGTTDQGHALGAGEKAFAEGGIFNPADQTWTALPDLPAGTPLAEYANGRAPQAVGDQVLIGGRFVLDPVAREVTALPQPSWGERGEATVITGPDSILVWGGATYDGFDGENRADGYLLGL